MEARRYALVTGASSGIGAAMARLLAREGFDVALAARRGERLDALARELRDSGAAADVFVADLAAPLAAEALADRIESAGRAVDALINNAGATVASAFAGTSLAEQRAFLELTATTPMALTHRLLPHMLARNWGRVINISSIAALSSGAKGNTLYPAGKSFLLKFSQSLNAETKARGVFVTAVLPGFVATEFQEANGIPMEGGARSFSQTPEHVAREAWVRNQKGHELVVPATAPKLAAWLMRALPEPWMRALTRSAAEKYYVGE
jgi:short-subunit dehydrogenase